MFGLEFSRIAELPGNFTDIETDLNSLNETFWESLEAGRGQIEFNYAADNFRNSLQSLELSAIASDNQELLKNLTKLRLNE